jgi:threonine dehydratase
MQKTGAFKFRGACNAVSRLSMRTNVHAVASHSSGNHGAALTLAARLHGLSATVVMPVSVSSVKQAAVRDYGGRIALCEPTDFGRKTTLAAVVSSNNAEPVHLYDDPRVIAG